MRTRRRPQSRRGSVYVLFAFALFAILPIVGLVVHTGLVTLARRQMQTAADSAAIEALRFRDDVRDGALAATAMVNRQPAAGATVGLDGGVPIPGTDLLASRQIVSAGQFAADPRENPNNDPAGDVVVGNYVPADMAHDEDPTYARTDFVPVDSASRIGGDYDSVLVRLRRTGETFAPGSGATADPPLPFLFGRGPYGGPDFLDRRKRGTRVRATAIARAEPAVVIGVPSPTAGLDEGLALFWLRKTEWLAAGVDEAQTVTVDAGGSITGDLVGAFIDREVTSIGRELTPAVPPTDRELGVERYVAIYDDTVETGLSIIVGFGIARMDQSGTTTITKLGSRLAVSNASAGFVLGGPDVEPTSVNAFFDSVRELRESEPILAPAGVRATK